MTTPWKPKAQPIYQTTDTFLQLVEKLNLGRTQLDSDLAYLDSAFGPLSGSSFELPGLTTTGKSFVDAINELDAEIGVISNLNTDATGNLVAAVNEIEAVFDASANRINASGTFQVITPNDIVLDATGNDIVLRDNGINFGQLSSLSGQLRIRSGASNATPLSFTNANSQFYGSVTLPSSGTGSITSTEITADTVDGAIDQLNTRINTRKTEIGTLASLTTSASSLVEAINKRDSDWTDLDSDVTDLTSELGDLESSVGTLSSLTTNAQGNLVAAVNEIEAVFDASANRIIADNTAHFTIDAELDIILDAKGNDVVLRDNGTNFARFSQVGTELRIQSGETNTTAMQFTGKNIEFEGVLTLPTTGTGSISSTEITANTVDGAIDQLNARINSRKTEIGTLASLSTTNKTNLVIAINEVSQTALTNIGTLTNLDTNAQGNLVAAINEVNLIDSSVGVLSSLNTTDKTSLVAALNEVRAGFAEVGDTTQLDPDLASSDVVDAINEIVGVFNPTTNTINATGDFTIDAAGKINLDADGQGEIIFKDGGTQFGKLSRTGTGSNLKVFSGTTAAMQFTGQNAQFYGSITLPTTGTGSISSTVLSNTVDGAIDELDGKVEARKTEIGTLSSLTTSASSLVEAINKRDSDWTALDSDVTALTSELGDLESAVGTINDDFDERINTVSKINTILATGGSEKLVDSDDIEIRINSATAGLTSFDGGDINTLSKINDNLTDTSVLVDSDDINTRIGDAITAQGLPAPASIIKTTDINTLGKLSTKAQTTLVDSATIQTRIDTAITAQGLPAPASIVVSTDINTLGKLNTAVGITGNGLIQSDTINERITSATTGLTSFDGGDIDTLDKINDILATGSSEKLVDSDDIDTRIDAAIDAQNLPQASTIIKTTDINTLGKLNTAAGSDLVAFTNAKDIDVDETELILRRGRIRAGKPGIAGEHFPGATKPQYSFLDDGNTGMYQDGANRLQFSANGAEVLRIDVNKCYAYKDLQMQSTSQILANPATNSATTLAAIPYSFRGDVDTGMYRNAANQIGWSCAGVREMYLTGSGLVVRRDITAFSDKRLKKEITPIANPLDVISGITGVKYTDIKSGDRCTGVIAQDVQKVLPEAVQENEEGILSVAYGNMVGVLIEAVKELQAEVAELKGSR